MLLKLQSIKSLIKKYIFFSLKNERIFLCNKAAAKGMRLNMYV